MPQPHWEAALSAAEIEEFFEVGWITRPSLFSADEVDRMRAAFDALEDCARRLPATGLYRGAYFVLGERHGRQVIRRVVWAGGCQPGLLDTGTEPRLTVPSAQLLGSATLDQLLNQAHFKRPHDGVRFDWHQDIRHRDKGHGTWRDVNGRGSFVQTLIVLDEMTPDSGPLMFIPGSAAWGRVDFGADDYADPDTPARAQYRARRTPHPGAQTLRPETDIRTCCRAADAVSIAAQPGDTLFFGPYTAHASFENTSDHYRRVLINGYAYPGANRRMYPGSGTGRRLVAPSAALQGARLAS